MFNNQKYKWFSTSLSCHGKRGGRANRYLFICTITGLFSYSAVADTISGTIDFTKKPPNVGVLYTVDSIATMAPSVVDQVDQEFSPTLIVSKVGVDFNFKNSDSIDHNIFANDKNSNVKFDVGLMPAGNSKTISNSWPGDSLTRISCKIHPKMRGYIANITSNSIQQFEFDRSKRNFDVILKDVAADSTSLKLLLPKYDTLEIDISKGETKSVDLMYKGASAGKISLTRN